MKRKFALDLPRLKIGSSKVETKKEIPIGFDSPPVTPKSVRPPLSPRTDYDLRTACALVLQEYKPSTQLYEEQYGEFEDAKRQLEYDTAQRLVQREMAAPSQTLSTLNTQTVPKPSTTEDDLNEEVRSKEINRDPAVVPDSALDAEQWERLQAQQTVIMERAQQLMSFERVEPKTMLAKPSHKRSASTPLILTNATPRHDFVERPRTAPRSDSMMTNGSTPLTDRTEYSRAASTAPTTAAITPARTSNRASHVVQIESVNGSVPYSPTKDGEWMRLDFDKHKKALEEAKAQQDLENQVIASVGGASAADAKSHSATKPTAPFAQIPARKPVPRTNSSSKRSINANQRAEGRPSTELRRSGSRRRTPRSESRHELDMLRPESRQAIDDFGPPSETPVMSNDIESVFQSRSVPAAPMPSVDVSRAQSRSRSITRQIREFIRSGSRNRSRDVSANVSRPESRSKSIDSFASSVSALAPSLDSTTNKWRSWKPFHRNQDSMSSAGVSRPGSSDSNTRGRGQQSPPQQKSKPAINLNRELPPLPSLDQWKPEEPEPPKLQHIASLIRKKRTNKVETDHAMAAQMPSTTPPRSQKPSVDTTSSSQRPRDSVLNDAPTRVHPQRKSSLRAPSDPFQNPNSNPTTKSLSLPTSPGLAPGPAKEQRRSRIVEAELSFQRSERMRGESTGQLPPDKPVVAGQGPVINYSRNSGGPMNGTVSRQASQSRNAPATTGNDGAFTEQYSRSTSEPQLNFSRKISSDDYSRMYDRRYQNVVEIKPKTKQTAETGAKPLPVLPKETPKKKKWWKPSSKKKQKREKTWMDEVVKSGSNSGLILTDGIADAPIVRY